MLWASGSEIQDMVRQSEHDVSKHLFVDQAIAVFKCNQNVSAAILLRSAQCYVLLV